MQWNYIMGGEGGGAREVGGNTCGCPGASVTWNGTHTLKKMVPFSGPNSTDMSFRCR